MSMSTLMSLQELDASINMCWPVFTPQILGGEVPPVNTIKVEEENRLLLGVESPWVWS